MKTLINRLKEPSTWASLAGLAVLAGVSMDQFNDYVLAVSGVFAFVGIFLKEKGGTDEETTEEGV